MKAIILKQYNEFEYVDMDRPLITSDDDVLINVKACGICSSDRCAWHGWKHGKEDTADRHGA